MFRTININSKFIYLDYCNNVSAWPWKIYFCLIHLRQIQKMATYLEVKYESSIFVNTLKKQSSFKNCRNFLIPFLCFKISSTFFLLLWFDKFYIVFKEQISRTIVWIWEISEDQFKTIKTKFLTDQQKKYR